MSNRMEIPVKQFTMGGEFIADYPSISEAARVNELNPGSIGKCLKNEHIHGGGYIWSQDEEEALSKAKVATILDEMRRYNTKRRGKIVVALNTFELQLLYARTKRFTLWKIAPRLLKDGTIRVTMTKRRPKYDPSPIPIKMDEPKRPNKPKWHLVYEVNLKYKYAMDFGYGDTEEEAINDFYKSRKDSPLKHNVIYVDRDYNKVLEHLLRKGGKRNVKCSMQRLYQAANLLPQQMPRISGI